MKHIQTFLLVLCAGSMAFGPLTVAAATNYYNGAYPVSSSYNYNTSYAPVYQPVSYAPSRDTLIREINRLLAQLQAQQTYTYVQGTVYYPHTPQTYSWEYEYDNNDSHDDRNLDDDEPDVDTQRVQDVTERSAELRGEVDMNDYRNGRVFFVYGEDEDMVEEIEDEYTEYRDIDEDGDDLLKFEVDSDLDGNENYWRLVTGLDDDTEYFYSICVEFEDDDDDEVIICGEVEDFETDRD